MDKTPEEVQTVLDCAFNALGRPYLFGAKWNPVNPEPTGPVDCSGFVRWCYAQSGWVLPDGSYAQYHATEPVDSPRPTDLAFFLRQGIPHHVGLLFDDYTVIEARGKPYFKVIERPRGKWENYGEFSGWRRLK